MNIKEVAIWVALIVFGYWLGSSGALARYMPGGG